MNAACYPGSFDPVTLGHADIVRRAARIFDRVVVAIGRNSTKSCLFDVDERLLLLRKEFEDLGPQVEVASFDGLVVDFCRARNLGVLVRGVRSVGDYEHEVQMALTNRSFAPELETLLVLPGERFAHVSSRLIKEVVEAGGKVDAFVSPRVARALAQKLHRGAPDTR